MIFDNKKSPEVGADLNRYLLPGLVGAHGLVPVVIPLTLDGLAQIAGIQPGLGGLDPVHDLLIHNIKFMT